MKKLRQLIFTLFLAVAAALICAPAAAQEKKFGLGGYGELLYSHVQCGEQIFAQANCTGCHTPSFLELGARFQPAMGSLIQATLFRNDFKRLIAVGSIAGGATPPRAGRSAVPGR